ncbi:MULTISPECIES: DUF3951 domain-containing protein [Paenibacillus]|jgi:hypothetical protein|uniref:Uncharacterized protein n=1 Tax=Paenibacillus odorifer TaxID=189426 RepID=A0A1R0X6B9_9BACL|nr:MULTISPECIES: DUF3951 domain-containing protein [Paenibacillus]ETT49307.1 hypothetical protein C171_23580 [Paenibacillus sp. FSL H8-237]MDH6426762.1 hypothetical protein [Paenibacillus sp. PastH-4]MDH6442788.1 hypothetical protein [Paenibacillus sp. PastF-4]MDH6526502.1 hypothetical protein [Paenibacillus sp. PastH-3]OMC69355.1 hypothetical protein BK125_27085 [Paenibacillus odorifer]
MRLVLFMLAGVGAIFYLSLGIIIVKVILTRKLPNNNYTPFDYITAQSPVEFHDEKKEIEENADHGDDKDKNIISLSKRRPSLP